MSSGIIHQPYSELCKNKGKKLAGEGFYCRIIRNKSLSLLLYDISAPGTVVLKGLQNPEVFQVL